MKFLIPLLLMISPSLYSAEGFKNERFYSNQICAEYFKGKPTDYGHIKPDCETDSLAIEFDWAKNPKHYDCIGQAIVYSYYTNKLPACVLLARNQQEYNFAKKQLAIFRRERIFFVIWPLFEVTQ